MKSILLWGGVGILIAGGLIAVFTFSNPQQNSLPEDIGPDYSVEMPYEGAAHVDEGEDVSYESNPPSSGPHWPDPLLDGIYETEKPDQALVHSLEHGRIWVSYQPTLPQAAIDQLKDIASKQPRVILTPRAASETQIALAAWQRIDTFDLNEAGNVDRQRILDFIARYRDKGPEYVPQMTGKKYE
jgi:hypothetical protein